jgi:hypothetical protein
MWQWCRRRARVFAPSAAVTPERPNPKKCRPDFPATRQPCTLNKDAAASLTGAAARSRWARLLALIYEVFPLRCPDCGSEMRLLPPHWLATPLQGYRAVWFAEKHNR